MSKLVLGLDVGIASVGWGIIDYETNKIIASGVRLFSERDKKQNETRRNSRSSRRLIRRREHRLERIKKILFEDKIITENFIPLENPYEIRVKGLNNKLSNEELATAILHIAKRRGVSGNWTVEESKKAAAEEESLKKILNENREQLKNKYICEIQLERLKNDGKVRGNTNCFNTSDYLKELDKIFENQNIKKETKEKIREIVEDRREYYEGPGNEKSITPYGRFIIKDGKVIELNFIEKMRGNCSVFPEEKRASKNSYDACLYNLLNDLNNLTIDGKSIDPNTKKIIIEEYINKKGNITVKQLLKVLNVNDSLLVHGFRTNKSEEPIITSFDGYKKVLNKVEKEKLNPIVCEDKELFNQISDILTSYKGIEERKEKIKELSDKLNDKDLEILANLTGFTQYHSLSHKALKLFINEMIETNYNQMQLLQINNWFNKKTILKSQKNISFNEQDILSPVAKRSHKEAIKVLNAIRKEYGELDSIVIEMAREKNSEDKKAIIKKIQKSNELLNQKVKEVLNGKQVNYQTQLKIRLYLDQECKTAYTGEIIDLDKLVNDPTAYEIDHIIPLSISLDDSYNNKVLVTHKENQDKGQRTPYEYFKSGKINENYEKFKARILSNNNISRRKKQNLFFERDINQYDVRKKFINRNLVDTRYATRSLLNNITNYYKNNEIDTKVYTINGNITNLFRKKTILSKDRDKDATHHAIDALIIAGIKKMKLMDNLLNLEIKDDIVYDKETGEVMTLENEKDFFDETFMNFLSSLKEVQPKFSHKIDSKVNRALSYETIYSTRRINDTEYTVGKYKNIYDKDGEKLAKNIRGGKEKKLLIYKHDKKSYDVLKSIVEEYSSDKNPFATYFKEHNEYIRKYSKKGNGAPIINIKYIDDKVGEKVIDLTDKFTNSTRRIIKKQLNPYRVDIYKTEDNKHKILEVKQIDIAYKNGKAYIDKNKYEQLKKDHNINEKDKFMFTLYKDSIIKVENEYIRYAGIQNIKFGIICYKTIDQSKTYRNDKEVRQPYINIKNATILEKYNVDVLGNMHKSANETCKLEIEMI